MWTIDKSGLGVDVLAAVTASFKLANESNLSLNLPDVTAITAGYTAVVTEVVKRYPKNVIHVASDGNVVAPNYPSDSAKVKISFSIEVSAL